MPFLTIFTAPKPFTNPHINIIQRNAIGSWKRLADVDVIVIGDEPGIPQAAAELGVRSVPQVKRDENGVPLVSSIMEIGHSLSDSPLLCYANADIILMSDMLEAARATSRQVRDFLLIGRRWNLDLDELCDFSVGWETRLRQDVSRRGKLFFPWGIDYFIFPRHLYTVVPDFSVGRVGWDNWMVYHARAEIGLAVDGTQDILAIHQNHDYSHLPGSKLYGTDAARANIARTGGRKHLFNTLDTNRELRRGCVRLPRPTLLRLARRLERVFTNDRGSGWSWELSLRFQRMQRWLLARQEG